MRAPHPLQTLLLVLLAASAALAQEITIERPSPAFELAAPEAPSPRWREFDLPKTLPAGMRESAHRLAAVEKKYSEAAQLQFWAVRGDPEQGRYDLGCYCALAGQADSAFYWLQSALLEEGGIDRENLLAAPELAGLHEDPRWPSLLRLAVDCQAYWSLSGVLATEILVPEGYAKGTPIPVVIALHRFGGSPRDFAGAREQRWADQLGVAILAPSGSVAIGRNKFRWSENPELDGERIRLALEEADLKLDRAPGLIALVGFSQGAQLAAELLARDPVQFAGAVVVCPAFGKPTLASIEPDPLQAGRVAIILSGAAEKSGNRAQAEADAQWFRAAGALTVRHTYAEMGHEWPGSADHSLPQWVELIFGKRSREGRAALPPDEARPPEDAPPPAAAVAAERPAPPLSLPAPAAPAASWQKYDLQTLDPALLRALASRAAYEQSRYAEAIQLGHWAVAADPGRGVYSLAIYHAQAGEVESALYWLQRAGLEEGIAPEWPTANPRFAKVIADQRWPQLRKYLEDCAAYWASQKHASVAVNLPVGYERGKPIAAIVALHGYYGYPEEVAGDARNQAIADELGAAIIAVSGTTCTGPNRFNWSGDLPRNLAHIREVLKSVATEVPVGSRECLALGFSEGAQLAIELAARDPGTYVGAIAIAPYSAKGSRLASLVYPSQHMARTAYVVAIGELAPREDHDLVAGDLAWLRKVGALAVQSNYPGIGRSWPPGSYDNIAIWAQLLFGLR